MHSTIIESQKKLSVVQQFDVVIVGAGIAGVAAALAACRLGTQVCLIEKSFSPGGLATLANVIVYLPLCDGEGQQVSGGIAEELLKLSIADGWDTIPECWQQKASLEERKQSRYRVSFNPCSFLLALEQILLEHRVEIFYDTRFCDVIKQDNCIKAVIVENKSGRFAIASPVVIDCSGDADVCAKSGEKTVSLDTNVRAAWFYYFEGEQVKLNKFSQEFTADGSKPYDDDFCYSGTIGRDVSAHIIESRKLLRTKLADMRSQSSESRLYPIRIPTIPSFRMTRRLQGRYELQLTDERRSFEDTIGIISNWRRPGPIYEIPLRCLTGVVTSNLITAGRCISTAGLWDQIRVIPACAVTGQAAGTAAALLVEYKLTGWQALNIAMLREMLLNAQVILSYE